MKVSATAQRRRPAPQAAMAAVCLPSLRTALLVGLLLNAVNNGPALARGSGVDWRAVGMDFLVPFCVAAYSRFQAERRR